MRNILFGLIILTIAATAAPAQSGKKLIFWSGDPNCGVKSRAISAPETVRCGSVITERGPVSSIAYDGITLTVAFLEENEHLIVGAQIANSTSDIIGFDSDFWGAAHFKTKAGFYAGEKPIAAETSIPSRDLLRVMAKGRKLENAAGDVVADTQMTTETRRIRRPDGTEYTRTTIVQDKSAKEAEARQQYTRIENLTNEQRRLRNTALTAKSVAPGATVRGLVYFQRFKKADFVVYSIAVDGTTFVFQLPKVPK